MKTSNVLVWLSSLVAMLALIAAGAGLFWPDEGGPSIFTTVHGETVQMFGQGLYRNNTLFTGAGFKGQDVVTLVLGIPLLALSILLSRRNALGGSLLLMGVLGYFLYVYASMALGAAYNDLFLIYIALFSASLHAFVLAFTSLDRQALTARFATGAPRRSLAAFMFAASLVTLVVWLSPLVEALGQGQPPKLLDSYTTVVTDVLDLGIIAPANFIAGLLVLRRNVLGYLVAFPLLALIVLLLPVITLSTVNQAAAGISFSTGEIVGPIAGFLVLGLLAMWIIAILLRQLWDLPAEHPAPLQAA
jgi:hypothetical protein